MQKKRIYDLTRPIYHNCPAWPGVELTKVDMIMHQPQDLANVESITSSTHIATHCDVPIHFHSDGKSLDEIEVTKFIGEGVIMDVSYKKDGEFITYEDLEKNGEHVKENDIVAIRTGYGQYYGFNKKYLMDWPAIDETGAKWIVEKRIKMVGCDTIGIECYGFKEGMVHKTILGAGIIIVEELNLEEIAIYGKKRWMFHWLPVLLKGGGGSFTRAIASEL